MAIERFDRIGTDTHSGTIQNWVVPQTGPYRITAAGAEGGHRAAPSFAHGRGATITGEVNLQQGDTLLILCGHKGGPGASDGGSGGGGGTFVVKLDAAGDLITGGFYASERVLPLIVAGGGMGEPNSAPAVASIHGRANSRGVAHQSIGHGTSSAGHGGGGGWALNGGGFTVAMQGLSFLSGGLGSNDLYKGGFGGGGGGGGSFNDGAGGGGYDGGDHSYSTGNQGGGGSYNAGINQINTEGSTAGGNTGNGWVEIELAIAPITLNGTATTAQNDPVDAVFIFDWTTGVGMGKAVPTITGAWEIAVYPTGTHYGVTYVAAGFQPITHGPYPVG